MIVGRAIYPNLTQHPFKEVTEGLYPEKQNQVDNHTKCQGELLF